MYKTINEAWDLLIEYGVATQKELELVACINSFNMDTMNSVLYVRTGYRNIIQLQNEIKRGIRLCNMFY
nr:MAG TPA: hypothetical protein [Caudoviricetes sp.]